MNLDELRQDKGKLITDMRALNDKSITAKKPLEGDDKTKYDRMEADLDLVLEQIARGEKLDKLASAHAGQATGIRAVVDMGKQIGKRRPNTTPEYEESFTAFLQNGQYRTHPAIMATLTKSTGTQVGYLAPAVYEEKIIAKAYPLVIMRKYATVDTSSSDSVIATAGNLPVFTWIDELGIYSETDITVGNIGMSAYKEGGVIKASEEIIQDAFVDLPEYIANQSRIAIAQSQDAAFFQGDGNKKPTGAAISATVGITTASTTTFTTDELLDFMDSLPDAYEPNARLYATKAWRSKVRKAKSSTGEYLWQPGLQAGVPDLLNGKELSITPYLGPLTAGSAVALYGDMSFYNILDRHGFYIQQLNETYALQGMVGFKIFTRLDGKLLNSAALVKMMMAAA